MIPSDQTPQWPESLPAATTDMFAMVAEHTHNAAIVTDPQYRILWANDSFTRITGYPLTEVKGRTPADFMRAPDSDPARAADIRNGVENGLNFSVVIRNRRKDGVSIWMRIEGKPIRDNDGTLNAFLVVGTDVTAQVEREMFLERNEALFNEAQRIARIGSWDYDLSTHQQQWSAETFRIHGIPEGDTPPAAADGIATFIEEHQPLIDAAFTQCCLMGVPYDIELQLRPRTGGVRWVRCIGRAYTVDNRVVRVAGTMQDIDDRKRAELEVARLAERMTLAAKFAGIGIWEYNEATGELIWDDAMLALHGMHRDAFPGNFSIWGLVMLPDDRASEEQINRAFAEGRGEFDVEYRVLTPDDDVRYIRNCGRIVRDADGRIIRSYGVNYDITRERVNMIALLESDESLRAANTSLQATIEEAQRLARVAEAANQAKSSFLATISHEIRTPLNGVIGMTNILAGTPLDAEQRDYLQTIKLSGESLLTLINDTLDYSKIEAGRVELERQPFDLLACVAEAMDLVEPHTRQKNLSLSRIISSDTPRMIEGDASRLRQILVNLLGNAVKFTDHGGILLETRVDSASADEVSLTFQITDTGIGIPKDKQARLFEHFFQVDASITRTHGGTGLGLAISRRLTELMGGTIEVESTLGRGSTFSVNIRVPVVIEDALTVHANCLARLAHRHALIVAIQPLRATIEHYARLAGLFTFSVPDATHALDRLATGVPCDLIISDPEMPGMDGLDFARALQARALKSTPLLPINRIGTLSDSSAPRFYQLMASLVPSLQSGQNSPTPPASQRIGDAMPLSILMAEDNNVNQRVAQLTLRRLGYEVEIVSDGAEALGALQRRSFDVILMDVQMSGMDGLEATRRIRALPQHQNHPWIIALTAGAFEEDRLNAFRAGMNDFLSKPLRVDLLHAALGRAWQALQTLSTEVTSSTPRT
ncbi:PAS domain-containing hybrid sensor histidine kinase/response regulator [Rariglobus hedericola]|uniref:Sensory/regulatory protein RpfC n=1 Tax=Rariglobus hedericola TaxID=2597822 RepID=A0A556QGM7_9BACT|nr:PAS domain-containing hybrid sensor histidine kinase/response regulator [Rariglobus hedericola]TSJ75788.1 response regulator [Rariglobus hedericola]